MKPSLEAWDMRGFLASAPRFSRSKTEKRRSNSWAFYQLREFIAYKANLASVLVVLHDPRYTSQMYSSCLRIGQRSGKRFACSTCGYSGDADYNAAKNLELLGLNVSQARGPWLHCQLQGS